MTIALFLMYVGGPGFGLLADKKGPRIIIVPAGILIVFAICMLSLSTEYYQIMLSEGVAFGIGASALFLSPIVCVGRWFTTKRGLATGIVASGSGLGKRRLVLRRGTVVLTCVKAAWSFPSLSHA